MADNETKVTYKAVANFVSVGRAVQRLRKNIAELRKEEAAFNAESVAGDKAVESAEKHKTKTVTDGVNKITTARKKSSAAAKQSVKDSLAESAAAVKNADSAEREAAGHNKAADATGRHKTATQGMGSTLTGLFRALQTATSGLARHRQALDGDKESTTRAGAAWRGFMSRLSGDRTLDKTGKKIDSLGKKISKALSSKSQLGGIPFAVLIPVITALVSAINPLISILGAASGAALGFANSLASLSGIAFAIPGVLSAVAAGVGSLIVAFSGVGGVFKAASKLNSAGSGGTTQEDLENQLADAKDRVARADKGVQKAQEGVNKARQQAVRDLEDLQKAVNRASSSEKQAIANLEQAKVAYNNVLADPSSTKADKDSALSDVTQAQQDLEDVRTQNKRNAEDLAEAKKKGIEGSDAVVSAQDQLTSAITEQRDAYVALRKAQAGATSGGTGSAEAFQKALDKLSPSARTFVLALLSMRGAWDQLHKSVQEAFFSKIVGDLELIRKFLPTIQNLLVKAAGAMGDVADKGIKLITSGPWTKDFAAIADNNVDVIHNLGDGFLSILTILKDITVAAAPFTKEITKSLAGVFKNLSKIVDTARKDGSLAAWLEKVRIRISQWWTIVKNVAQTLFNYGKAASGFGDWITQGLIDVTDGWKKASEEATKKNSPFQKWLEDIKPLLKELKGLLGDFFGWLSRTSGDPKNIKTATDLLKTIRKDLGPALGKLLDQLGKSGVADSLVKGVSRIVDALNSLLKNGGSAGIKTFFDIIVGFLNAVAYVAGIPGIGQALVTIAGALAAISVLRFASKFTGVTGLVTSLLGLSGKESTLTKIFRGLRNIDKLKFKKLIGAAGAVGLITLGAASVADAVKEGVNGAPKSLSEFDKAKKDAKGNSPASRESSKEHYEKGIQNGGKTLAQIGGAVPSTLLGAVDSVAGTDLQTPFKKWLDDVAGPMQAAQLKAGVDAWHNISTWWNGVVGLAKDTWNNVSTWWSGVVGLAGDIWTNVSNWWNGVVGLAGDTWTNVSNWWNGVVGLASDIWTNVQNWWNGVVGLAGDIWTNVSNWWNGVVGMVHDTFYNIGSWWDGVVGMARDTFYNIGRWWDGVVGLARDTWNNVSSWFLGVINTIGKFFGFSKGGSTTPGPGNNHTVAPGGKARVYASGGKVSYLASGGSPIPTMKPRGTDTLPSMLTPGEFVLRKAVVDSVGEKNLEDLNAGLISYTDLLNRAMKNQPASGKGKPGPAAGGPVKAYLAGGGLVDPSVKLPAAMTPVDAQALMRPSKTQNIDNSTSIGEVTIINPKPERASDSLTRTIRSVSRYGSKGKVDA